MNSGNQHGVDEHAKKIVFVDFPAIVNGVGRPNLHELFKRLGEEFDEIRTFAKIPKEPVTEKDIWGLIRVATNAGGFPTIYPSDVDPFIVEEVRRALDRKDVGEIAILSGDVGYYEVLRTVKRAGLRVKIILPSDNQSFLLRSIADEVVSVEAYASEYSSPEPGRVENAWQRAEMNSVKTVEAAPSAH